MNRVIALILLPVLVTACASRTAPLPAYTAETPGLHSMDQVLINNAQIDYYEIKGSTANELRLSMDELRPKDPYDNDRPVDAYTDWYISWNWPGYGTIDCDLSAAVVDYKIRVILPHWEPPTNVSPEFIGRWERYIQNLVLHEKGHVNHILENYLDVRTAIQNATCATAESEAQKVLDRLRGFDSSYDSETRHGETQGAVFP